MGCFSSAIINLPPFLGITKLTLYEALSLSPYSPVSSLPFSFACLATLRVDFFNYWIGAKRICAEVTQVE